MPWQDGEIHVAALVRSRARMSSPLYRSHFSCGCNGRATGGSVCGMCRSTFCFPRAPLVDTQSPTAATSWIACRCPMCARHPTDRAAYLKLGIYVGPGVSTEPNPLGSAGDTLPAYGFLTAPDPTMPGTLIPVSPFVVHVGCCGKQCGKSVSKPR